MTVALACQRCGAALPPAGAHGPVQCSYCGTTSVPAARVVEKVVERIVVVPQGDGLGAALAACPRCANAMSEGRYGPHLVRGCQRCGGVFLEPDAVSALERARDEGILRTVLQVVRIPMPFPMDRRLSLTCPFCKTALTRRHLGETGHSIDSCAAHGTFFDRGEVPAFAEFCEQRRATP